MTCPAIRTAIVLLSLAALVRVSVLVASLFLFPIPGLAAGRASPDQICDQAAHFAARKTGVPLAVLQAITRTETGRKSDGRFTPWPWTVNMEGKGVWFDTLDEARAYVFRHFKRGARSFDVGCFQINYRWHHKAFTSIDEMFEPEANAVYAAEFLRSLYEETGNWTDAAGAYHSRTPKHADRYKAIFEKHRRNAPGADAVLVSAEPGIDTGPRAATAVPRMNRYPLLRPGAGSASDRARLGSLVPVGTMAMPGGFLRLDGNRSGLMAGG